MVSGPPLKKYAFFGKNRWEIFFGAKFKILTNLIDAPLDDVYTHQFSKRYLSKQKFWSISREMQKLTKAVQIWQISIFSYFYERIKTSMVTKPCPKQLKVRIKSLYDCIAYPSLISMQHTCVMNKWPKRWLHSKVTYKSQRTLAHHTFQ